MALTCDWCHKPIYGVGRWGYEVSFRPFYSLSLGAAKPADGPRQVVMSAHVHPVPCRDELGWAVQRLLDDREPLETDGPLDEDDERDLGGPSEEEERRRQERQEKERQREEEERKWELHKAWNRLPPAEKDRLVLEQLGDDSLRIGELIDRLKALFTHEVWISDGAVRPALTRLREAREIDRTREPRSPGSKQMRWCWFRRRELEGPIVDLERQLREGGED